jgi:SulP family sulfate permease
MFFASVRGYRRDWLRGDLIAGLTVWAVLIPESLAYASIAGVSPVVGLYAAPGALIFYAAFGSSKHLVTGPMAATAALSAAAVGDVAAGHSGAFAALTVTLAITVGAIALLAGLARLGFVASFISEPVLKGFIIGLALTIIVGQVPKVLGVEKGEGDFFQQAWAVLAHLGDAQWRTVLVGLTSLAIVLGLRQVAPVVPAPLVAVGFGVLAVYALGLQHHEVKIVGHIGSGLPSFGLPSVPSADYLRLAGPAVGVMLVGFAEGLGAAKTYAARDGYEIDANRELAGLGAANLAAGLSSGMVVNGSLSKTAVNGSAGARTQVSGLFVAALTVLTLLFLTGLFQDLPEATLGAVVIAALLELVDVDSLVSLYRTYTARLGRIYGPVLGQVPGTGQWADVAQHPEDRTVPGVAVLRVESGLFFGNSDHVAAVIRRAAAAGGVRAVVLDCETAPFVDVTAARMLDELTAGLRERGVRLVIAREVGQVRDVLAASGASPSPAPAPEYFRSVREAVEMVREG